VAPVCRRVRRGMNSSYAAGGGLFGGEGSSDHRMQAPRFGALNRSPPQPGRGLRAIPTWRRNALASFFIDGAFDQCAVRRADPRWGVSLVVLE